MVRDRLALAVARRGTRCHAATATGGAGHADRGRGEWRCDQQRRCRKPHAALCPVHRTAHDPGCAGSAEAPDHAPAHRREAPHAGGAAAAHRHPGQGHRRSDTGHQIAKRPSPRCAAAEAHGGWRRLPDADRPAAHAIGLDPGAARTAWRPGEDNRRRSHRAAASARPAGGQARVSGRRNLHPGRRPGNGGGCAALRRDRDQRTARRRGLRGGCRAVQPRIRRRCRVARWAGCSPTSSIPTWHASSPKCRWEPSAIR